MAKKFRYTLQRTMIIYFLLIGFAAFMVGVEFIAETYSPSLRSAWVSDIEIVVGHTIDCSDIFQPLDRLAHKVILMIFIILSVVVIVLTMFIKNITGPLQHMIEKSNEISKGDLSQTITVDANNELADLGAVINEMSSNLQEIIHFSLNTCISGKMVLAETQALCRNNSISSEDLSIVRKRLAALDLELASLQHVVDCFKFYSIEKESYD